MYMATAKTTINLNMCQTNQTANLCAEQKTPEEKNKTPSNPNPKTTENQDENTNAKLAHLQM